MADEREDSGRWRLGLFAAGLLLLHFIELEILPFVLGALIGFLTDPLIHALKRRLSWPRWVCASLLFILVFASLGGLVVGAGLPAAMDALAAARSGAGPLRSGLQALLGPGDVQLFGARFSADALVDGLQNQIARHLTIGLVGHLLPAVLAAVVGLVIFLFVSFYTMVSGRELASGAVALLPPSQRSGVRALLPELDQVLRRYFTGVMVIVAFTSLFAWLGYGLIAHIRNAVLLSLTLGLLETVPAIGPIIAAALVAVSALQLHSPAALGFMVAYAVVLRFTVDDLVVPIVLGRSISAHPVVIMLAYVLGAALFGVVGLLLAAPAVAVFRIVLQRRYAADEAEASADGGRR